MISKFSSYIMLIFSVYCIDPLFLFIRQFFQQKCFVFNALMFSFPEFINLVSFPHYLCLDFFPSIQTHIVVVYYFKRQLRMVWLWRLEFFRANIPFLEIIWVILLTLKKVVCIFIIIRHRGSGIIFYYYKILKVITIMGIHPLYIIIFIQYISGTIMHFS